MVIKENRSDEIVDKIENVFFNSQAIPLSKRDYLGNRGKAFFYTSPGKKTIKWTIRVESGAPKEYRKEVVIPQRAALVYILIDNDQFNYDIIQ